MKPSERRALKAEKEALKAEQKAEKEATKREKELLRRGQSDYDDTDDELDESNAHEGGENTESGTPRKEGFFQSHIRLITFIVCMVLIVTVLGPWGIDMLVSQKRNDTVKGERLMTVDTVNAIYDSVGSITFKSLEDFTYTDLSLKSGYIIREYPIEGTDVVLKIGAAKLTANPDYMHLIDYEYNTPRVNIMEDDPESFFIEYEERRQAEEDK